MSFYHLHVSVLFSFQGTAVGCSPRPSDESSLRRFLKIQFVSFRFPCPKNESSKPNNIMFESTYKVRCLCFTTSPVLHRKEVIQPHLPIRLPCYDFTLITSFTFDCVLLAVRLQASGPPGSHGVTGGVYKARERIHRGMLIRDY